MSQNTPAVVVYNSLGVEVTGSAGSPSTSALTIQGISGGTVVPISGAVTVTSGSIAATQSGTWTVQPGNTANTTPWLLTINQGGNSATVTASNALKVDGSAVTQPVSGTVTAAQATAANLNATVVGLGTAGTPSGGVLTVQGSASGTAIPVTGTLTSALVQSATGTLTSVASSATSVSLLASNTSRKGAIFFNDSTSIVRIGYASSSSATSYTVLLFPGTSYEMSSLAIYTGAVSAIWVSANGSMRITELS